MESMESVSTDTLERTVSAAEPAAGILSAASELLLTPETNFIGTSAIIIRMTKVNTTSTDFLFTAAKLLIILRFPP
jgi:hypothetical protein